MLKPVYGNQFEKDVKLAQKRRKNLDSLKDIIRKLIAEESLPSKNKDHVLIRTFKGRRECHVAPDWVLIYKVEGSEITFERTGSHSDLFR
ncbi:MAG TPA: type II toxin-antitoxin system YafQ family toxin [Patescibacteria group bacterium]|nr:type II toxin-antitoxin system YafQ family toxin [Patescibacteria group bacterium]